MTNNNLEKAICKAIISQCNKSDINSLNDILRLSRVLDSVYHSQDTLAARIGLSSRQFRNIQKKLQSMNVLNVTVRAKYTQTNIYSLPSLLLKIVKDSKDVLSACKQYLIDNPISVQIANFLPYINNIKNRFFSSSSSSKDLSFKSPRPTFNARPIDSKQNQYTFGESFYFDGQVGYESGIGSGGVNKLTGEEWEEILEPKKKSIIEKLSEPWAIEWAQWALKFGANDEANSITAICQQGITSQSVGQDSNYHF